MGGSEVKAPLSYRPEQFDDWGFVRDADGHLVLVAKNVFADQAAHQLAGTDPCRERGEEIVRKLNAHETLLAACRATLGWLQNRMFDTSLFSDVKTQLLEAIIAATPDESTNIQETVSDGHGSSWSIICPDCGTPTVSVVRPGKAQCSECGR